MYICFLLLSNQNEVEGSVARQQSSCSCTQHARTQALGDIQIALKVLRGGGEGPAEHPVDRHYHSLNCDLSPIDHEDGLFKVAIASLTITALLP